MDTTPLVIKSMVQLNFFLTDEGERGSKYHWKRANNGPTLNAGLVVLRFVNGIQTSIAKERYTYVIFQVGGGGSGPPIPTYGSAHAFVKQALHVTGLDICYL